MLLVSRHKIPADPACTWRVNECQCFYFKYRTNIEHFFVAFNQYTTRVSRLCLDRCHCAVRTMLEAGWSWFDSVPVAYTPTFTGHNLPLWSVLFIACL